MRILRRIKSYKREEYSICICGLGNPGISYYKTLHNAGFMALDLVAQREKLSFSTRKGRAAVCSMAVDADTKVLFIKPLTFMNLSGGAVKYFLKKFRLSVEKLIVVHDDLDIQPGRIKMKRGGGTGGHRGVESITAFLGRSDYVRIKIGVGRPPFDVNSVSYLLSPPLDEIKDDFSAGVHHGADAIMMSLKEGIDRAFNYYNSDEPYGKH